MTPIGSRKPLTLALFVVVAVAACSGGGGFDSGPISLGLAVADFNGDGRTDLAVAYTQLNHPPPHASTIGVYLQQGGGAQVLAPANAYAVGDDTWNAIAADVDGDGRPDIVSVDYNSQTLSLLLNDPQQPGHFQAARTLPSGHYPQQVVAADVDQDGHVDLIEAFSGGIAIHLQDPTAPGSFVAAITIPISNCCGGLAVGDLNGDRLSDIAVVDQGSNLRILFQDPGARGSFLTPVSRLAGTTGWTVSIADLNGDGANDLIYSGIPTTTGPSMSVVVALQDPQHPGQFPTLASYATGDGVGIILVSDLDQDGHPDLVVGTGTGISFLFQDPARLGRFLPAKTYAPYFENNSTGDRILYDFSYIALGDVNGDGLEDIIVGTGPSSSGPGVVPQLAGHPGQFGNYQDLH